MVAVLDPTSENTQVILLHNVSWETYERLIEEQGENPNPHFTYDRGDLEIMVLSYAHETINRLIADIFSTIAMEIGVDFCHAGSTAFKHKDHAKGFAPDSSFTLKMSRLSEGKRELI